MKIPEGIYLSVPEVAHRTGWSKSKVLMQCNSPAWNNRRAFKIGNTWIIKTDGLFKDIPLKS